MTAPDSAIKSLLADCDQCVKCGLCLPVCPTYNYYKSESDSPRGRISLIQGLARGDVDSSDPSVIEHLDRCLGCAACESACPSGVAYLQILDSSKAMFKIRQFPKWQLDILSNPSSIRKAIKLGGLIPASLHNLLPDRYTSLLKLSPNTPDATISAPHISAIPQNRERIALFSGCAGSLFDRAAINALTRLLQALDFDVVETPEGTCCGALHLHEGYQQEAENIRHNSINLIQDLKANRLIYFASACAAPLKAMSSPGIPMTEATAFLSELAEPYDFVKPAGPVAVHTPCTLLNQSQDWPAMKTILKKVAGEQLIELPGNAVCCGSAGLHMVKHPDTARALLSPKLDALQKIMPEVLLTSNTGCAIHFRAGIAEQNLPVKVMHPAEWISLQILEQMSLSKPV